VKELVESSGEPIISPFSNEPYSVRIDLPDGFEYTVAEIGRGGTKTTTDVDVNTEDSYGQFCVLHMNESGVIR
jgi:hypothetical protein